MKTNTTPLQTFEFEMLTVDSLGKIKRRQTLTAEYCCIKLGQGRWKQPINLDMILVPASKYFIGAPEDELGRGRCDYVRGSVHVPEFYLGRYPITQAQWKVVAALEAVEFELPKNPSKFKGDQRPVEGVSWLQAGEFCARLSRLTGQEYRLPTEIEWEYACRAGTLSPFHFGDTITTELANYGGDPYGDGPQGKSRMRTTNVGEFSPNRFGLSDMHGNVSEWCQGEVIEQPAGEGSDLTTHPVRGGDWLSYPSSCRSACRSFNNGSYGKDGIGFRVACNDPDEW